MALPGEADFFHRKTPARLEVASSMLDRAVAARGHAGVAAEVAGEGALITPAGLEGDIAEGKFALVEEADGFVEADLVQKLQWAHLEESLNALFELIDRKSCVGGEIFDPQAFSIALAHESQRL